MGENVGWLVGVHGASESWNEVVHVQYSILEQSVNIPGAILILMGGVGFSLTVSVHTRY